MTTATVIAAVAILAALAHVVIHTRRALRDDVPEGWRASVRTAAFCGLTVTAVTAIVGSDLATGLLIAALCVGLVAPRLVEEIHWESAA